MRLPSVFVVLFAFAAGSIANVATPKSLATVEKNASAAAGEPGPQSDEQPIVWPVDAGSPEQILYAQPERMRDALSRISAREPGKPNLYVISFAGDSEENVFRNEAEYVDKLFSERFAAKGHVLTLVNNPATLSTYPIASLSNLELAIDGIGKKMNPDQDLLMVFITTHGSRKHELYVSLDPLPLDQIVPDDLADLFTDSPIRHRVFVISACYSGGFVNALRNPDTMVITAARGDRASFGCGTQSEITDFGRAFFVDGLNHTASFSEAFSEASHEVDAWETRDHQPHSFPQMATAAPIEAALKAWRDTFKAGPSVPFAPKHQAPPENAQSASALHQPR
ncbi:MAG: C13 family peptidase [Rudaea sp.]